LLSFCLYLYLVIFVLLCFCVATVSRWIKIYIMGQTEWTNRHVPVAGHQYRKQSVDVVAAQHAKSHAFSGPETPIESVLVHAIVASVAIGYDACDASWKYIYILLKTQENLGYLISLQQLWSIAIKFGTIMQNVSLKCTVQFKNPRWRTANSSERPALRSTLSGDIAIYCVTTVTRCDAAWRYVARINDSSSSSSSRPWWFWS